MTAICVGSIRLCALRVTLLDSIGNIAPGPNNYATTQRILQLQFTGNVDKGKDLFYRDGCDRPLAVYKSPELLKRFDLQLDQMQLEPAVQSIMLGAPILLDGPGDPVGWEYALQDCPSDPSPPLVALEAWTYSNDCDAQVPTMPYWYFVWPMVQWSTDQAQILTSDLLQPKLTGFTRRNPIWGHGPYGGVVQGPAGGPAFKSSTGGAAVFLTSTPPPAQVCGFQTVTPGS